MNKKRFIAIICLSIVLSILLTTLVSAGPIQNLQSFFQGGYQNYNKIIDFMIFFTLFFAVSFLGFSKWFGEGFGQPGAARGPVVGISLALAMALAFALITQTTFSVLELFPIALLVMFLVFFILFYGLFSHVVNNKFLAFLAALALTYALIVLFLFFYCYTPDNEQSFLCKSKYMAWGTFWGKSLGGGSYYSSSSYASSGTSGYGFSGLFGGGSSDRQATIDRTRASTLSLPSGFCAEADNYNFKSQVAEAKSGDGIIVNQEVINLIYLKAGWDPVQYPEGSKIPDETAKKAYALAADQYGINIGKDLIGKGRGSVFPYCKAELKDTAEKMEATDLDFCQKKFGEEYVCYVEGTSEDCPQVFDAKKDEMCRAVMNQAEFEGYCAKCWCTNHEDCGDGKICNADKKCQPKEGVEEEKKEETKTPVPSAGLPSDFCTEADQYKFKSKITEAIANDGIIVNQEVINLLYTKAGWDYFKHGGEDNVPIEIAQEAFKNSLETYGINITKDLVNEGRGSVSKYCPQTKQAGIKVDCEATYGVGWFCGGITSFAEKCNEKGETHTEVTCEHPASPDILDTFCMKCAEKPQAKQVSAECEELYKEISIILDKSDQGIDLTPVDKSDMIELRDRLAAECTG